ncbi:hypothetical protein Dvina_04235 [Dactylosporangium vinaceum]|uniref:Tetratricopeptide repeat protein n=1 Tax=Dactylosporangium vinaceum TaxID=53362 RepID=A0ABV5M0E5_9ACTN|nr:tetratricopeptide repeat protein [Dactylosporangium vinaceum]UAB97394.1 hypothetical protein Dvina_04235 [Dactylosporangium vinaceum]
MSDDSQTACDSGGANVPHPLDRIPSANTVGDPFGRQTGSIWLRRARIAARRGDYRTAAHAALEATITRSDTSTVAGTTETWRIRAFAHAALGRPEEALLDLARAIRMEPNVADHRVAMGGVFEDLGNWHAALDAYQQARRLAPDEPAPCFGMASVLTRAGAADAAVEVLSSLNARTAGDAAIRDRLALALVEAAERIPAVGRSDWYLITSAREIKQMRLRLHRAARFAHGREVRALVDQVGVSVERNARREFRWDQLYAGSTLAALLLAVALSGGTARVVSEFVPGLLPMGPVVALAAAATLLRYAYSPRWRYNAQSLRRRSLTRSPVLMSNRH